MFTGLIESVGRVTAIEDLARGKRLRVATELAAALHTGDSLAVNGVCLTVTEVRGSAVAAALKSRSGTGLLNAGGRDFSPASTGATAVPVEETGGVGLGEIAADVSPETLRVTTLGDFEPFTLVNLERPMAADGRFGGHIVQGHVDTTGTIAALEPDGEFYRLTVTFPPDLAPFFIEKGSVAVDGISLTIAGLEADRFTIQIIPHTWQHTHLQAARPGARVNLECDLVGKYVVNALRHGLGRSSKSMPED
jgi:riboflavin synthase